MGVIHFSFYLSMREQEKHVNQTDQGDKSHLQNYYGLLIKQQQ